MPATAEKIDLCKELKAEYATPKKPKVIETTPGTYLSIAGRGGPDGPAFQGAFQPLYSMAYTIKFQSKFAGRDFKVAPAEGLYWGKRKAPARPHEFACAPRDDWHWQLMIRVPEFIGEKHLEKAVAALEEKGKAEGADGVTLEKLHEGRCVQMLHVGPYDQTRETIDAMEAFREAEGLKSAGVHHEIYLSDPRRVPPERLRTILRAPVK